MNPEWGPTLQGSVLYWAEDPNLGIFSFSETLDAHFCVLGRVRKDQNISQGLLFKTLLDLTLLTYFLIDDV